jgi:hypothetical protein
MSSEVRTYLGSCHCGAVRFSFRSEPITAGIRCNCSICARRGAVMSSRYYSPEELEFEGKEALSPYQFGDHMMNHWFCRRCGVHPFSEVIEGPRRFRVNLGCVDGVDSFAVAVTLIDGRSF